MTAPAEHNSVPKPPQSEGEQDRQAVQDWQPGEQDRSHSQPPIQQREVQIQPPIGNPSQGQIDPEGDPVQGQPISGQDKAPERTAPEQPWRPPYQPPPENRGVFSQAPEPKDDHKH